MRQSGVIQKTRQLLYNESSCCLSLSSSIVYMVFALARLICSLMCLTSSISVNIKIQSLTVPSLSPLHGFICLLLNWQVLFIHFYLISTVPVFTLSSPDNKVYCVGVKPPSPCICHRSEITLRDSSQKYVTYTLLYKTKQNKHLHHGLSVIPCMPGQHFKDGGRGLHHFFFIITMSLNKQHSMPDKLQTPDSPLPVFFSQLIFFHHLHKVN